jgi:hypothetical protein
LVRRIAELGGDLSGKHATCRAPRTVAEERLHERSSFPHFLISDACSGSRLNPAGRRSAPLLLSVRCR